MRLSERSMRLVCRLPALLTAADYSGGRKLGGWAQFAARTGLDSVHQNDDVEPEPVWNLERDQRTERVLQAGSRLVVARDADSDRF